MSHDGFLFERDEQRRRVIVTLSSTATLEVWWRAASALVAENVWRDSALYDMSAVESAPMLLNLPNLVPMVANLTRTHGRREAVAVVVPGSDVTVWRHRLSGLFHGVLEIEAFSDLASAHEWLDRMEPR